MKHTRLHFCSPRYSHILHNRTFFLLFSLTTWQIVDGWWTQLTTNIQDESKNQFENKNQTENINRFENKNQTENKNESENIDQKENARQIQKINQTEDINESENKNKTEDKNQTKDKEETEDKNQPEKTYPDFACPKKLKCVFWNPEKYKQGNTTTGGWVGDGCSFEHTSNTNASECRCDRLANFALLMVCTAKTSHHVSYNKLQDRQNNDCIDIVKMTLWELKVAILL